MDDQLSSEEPMRTQDLIALVAPMLNMPTSQTWEYLTAAAQIVLVAAKVRPAALLTIPTEVPTPDFGDLPVDSTRYPSRDNMERLFVHWPGNPPPGPIMDDVTMGEYLGYLTPMDLENVQQNASLLSLDWMCDDSRYKTGTTAQIWPEVVDPARVDYAAMAARLAAAQAALTPSGLVVTCHLSVRLSAQNARRIGYGQ